MISQNQQKAIETITYAHDEMKPAISDLCDICNGGNVGWNTSCEMDGSLGILQDKWARIEGALRCLQELVEEPE